MIQPPRILFCPFCGSGTLRIGLAVTVWECMKCHSQFTVGLATVETASGATHYCQDCGFIGTEGDMKKHLAEQGTKVDNA